MAGMQLGTVKNGIYCFDGNWFDLKFEAKQLWDKIGGIYRPRETGLVTI